jgi:two-component system KDP operon response regulator KdpE
MMNDLRGQRVLIVDDEPELLKMLLYVFGRTAAQVHTAQDGPEALRKFFALRPDLVLLDLMMPGMDGLEVCHRIREISDVPIIILTATDNDRKIVESLECGADDYVTKPFSPSVLLARAQSVLRRTATAPTPESASTYHDGYLMVDLDKRRVWVCGERVFLSTTEHDVLTYFVRNAGRLLTFEQILSNVWGKGCERRVEYVHTYITRLRRKLEMDPTMPRYFSNERGVGYRFQAEEPGAPLPPGIDGKFSSGDPQ